jgi:hypothetical protein
MLDGALLTDNGRGEEKTRGPQRSRAETSDLMQSKG